MKYLAIVSKLSFIFLLMVFHFSLVKQWVHAFSSPPILTKLTTIDPIMIHFMAPIPPAPPLPMPVPDKKLNVKMKLPKSEVKQQQKLNKSPILPVQVEKVTLPQNLQKSKVLTPKKPPIVPKENLVKKQSVAKIAEKAVEKPVTTVPVPPRVKTQTAIAPATTVKQSTQAVSQIVSQVSSDSKVAVMPKNAISQSNSSGKSTSQSFATAHQTQSYTPPNHRAAYLHNPKPHYPEISQQLEEQGTVQLLVYVSSLGQVSQVQVKHSSGYLRLDMAALQAVKQWQCNNPRSHHFSIR